MPSLDGAPDFRPAKVFLATLALVSIGASPAMAWSNHTLCTWQAIAVMPEITHATVQAESIDGFLAETAPELAHTLDTEEQWATHSLAAYAPRPEPLRFDSSTPPDSGALRRRFLQAIRVNDGMPISLYVQHPPGAPVSPKTRVPWAEVSILPPLNDIDAESLERLNPGTTVLLADVIATASNEPDMGLDIGLWEDNGSPDSALYGFGPQPFGNPELIYGSQAPFHMGFYHEVSIIYRAAPFVKRTYPEARIHLYMTLSRFAFAHGHAYWSARFAGWALHYVQDLSQPYHARLLPGVSTGAMLWINILNMAGLHHARETALIRVTNRHLALENFQYHHMKSAYLRGNEADILLRALRDTSGDNQLARLTQGDIRKVVSAQSAAAANTMDAQIARSFAPRYVQGTANTLTDSITPDLNSERETNSPRACRDLLTLLANRMTQVGRDTRATLRALLPTYQSRPSTAPSRT